MLESAPQRVDRRDVGVPCPPSIAFTHESAATVGNWMTAFGVTSPNSHSTIAVVAGSDAAYSS